MGTPCQAPSAEDPSVGLGVVVFGGIMTLAQAYRRTRRPAVICMNRVLAVLTSVVALALPPLLAAAQTDAGGSAYPAAYLAANCANCHGTNGHSVTAALPTLAGMPKETIARSLIEFRDGKRSATLMQQLAKGYSDEQIALLAEYFSRQTAK
jgi:sulfide dehydrogenase cytochrome subunit